MNSSNVDLLIGTNNADLLLQRDFRQGDTNETGTLSKLDPNLLSPTEQQVLQILENNTILKRDYFERPLLWQSESPKLPNNRTLAKKRFQSLENKFSKNLEFAELYRKQTNEYIDLGHAVKLTNDHSLNISDITNYIPHHDVLNMNKPS